MAYKILLNKELLNLDEIILPCLVHYGHKEGGSQFSVTLAADLFLKGLKILFFTAYPMARDNFMEQVGKEKSGISIVENESQLAIFQQSQAIILKSGDEKLYLQALDSLRDLKERVVLIKNFEIFDEDIIDRSLNLGNTIFSGNIDESKLKNKIDFNYFKTIIAFSNTEKTLPVDLPTLEKYEGYLSASNDLKGIIELTK